MSNQGRNQDFISYILDNFIRFKRQFVIETNLSIEECLSQLESITQTYGYGTSRPIYSRIERGIKNDHHRFTVIAQDGPNENGRKNAVIEGVVTVASNGNAIVRGEARMKIFPNWLIIAVVGAIFVYAASVISNTFFNVISIFAWIYGIGYTLPILLFLWTSMYRDRNKLIRIVNDVTHTPMKSRLRDNNITREAFPLYEDEQDKQQNNRYQ